MEMRRLSKKTTRADTQLKQCTQNIWKYNFVFVVESIKRDIRNLE